MVVAAVCCGDVFPLAGTVKLVRIERMMDGAKYREILEGKPISVFERFETGMEVHLPAGQDPKHT
jgi:hypothetical protein